MIKFLVSKPNKFTKNNIHKLDWNSLYYFNFVILFFFFLGGSTVCPPRAWKVCYYLQIIKPEIKFYSHDWRLYRLLQTNILQPDSTHQKVVSFLTFSLASIILKAFNFNSFPLTIQIKDRMLQHSLNLTILFKQSNTNYIIELRL